MPEKYNMHVQREIRYVCGTGCEWLGYNNNISVVTLRNTSGNLVIIKWLMVDHALFTLTNTSGKLCPTHIEDHNLLIIILVFISVIHNSKLRRTCIMDDRGIYIYIYIYIYRQIHEQYEAVSSPFRTDTICNTIIFRSDIYI